MPASRSPKQSIKPVRRSYGWLIAVGVIAAAAVVLSALPASLALRFLPQEIQAGDPSGTLWHGSFGQFNVSGRAIGAIEWRIHPLSLLTGSVQADLHWVKQGFVADALVELARGRIRARNIQGSGALEDLADLGVTRGWSGGVQIGIADYGVQADKVTAASGAVTLTHLSSKQFGAVDIGDYELRFEEGSVRPDGTATGTVRDLRGLLQVNGSLSITPAQHVATLTGTVKERGEPPPDLRQALNNLLQLHGRDSQGRIPVDLEFTL